MLFRSWASGKDVDNTPTDNRDDIFGDPLHSRPIVINYGGTVGTRVLIGTNSGFIHMFKDDEGDPDVTTDDKVEESWAWMPYNLVDNIVPLKDAYTSTGKIYGVDGAPTLYVDDVDSNGKIESGDKAWVFFGMRRGGSKYYALDVSDPDNPSIMWILDSSSDVRLAELGQTWSKPKVIYHPINQDSSGNPKPTLVFGAGYSINKDSLSFSSDPIGRGAFMVDAESGAVKWAMTPLGNADTTFPGSHSVAAAVAPFDGDFDGYTDRLYLSDTGGNIWRVDMPGSSSGNWTVYKFAELGKDVTGALAVDERRFLAEPAVARSFFKVTTEITVNGDTTITQSRQPYDAVIIGSGNRASPLETNVEDSLFVLRDTRTLSEPVTSTPTPIRKADLLHNNASATELALELDDEDAVNEKLVELSGLDGWYYSLAGKEKSLSPSVILGGYAYFTTYTPSETYVAGTCVYDSNGRLYAFDLNYGIRLFKNISITTTEVPDQPTAITGDCPDGTCLYMVIPEPDSTDTFVDPPEHTPTCAEPGGCDIVPAKEVRISTYRSYLYTEEKGAN